MTSPTDDGDDRFELCELLDEYGCSIQSIPTNLRFAIETSLNNYTLPYDPCEYSKINVSWIWSQIPEIESYLSLFSDDDYDTVSCYVLIQEPLKSILSTLDTDKSYLVTYEYWFGDSSDPEYDFWDNTGKCDIYNLTKALDCDDTNRTYNEETTECLSPFVPSPKYKRDYLEPYGMGHCGLPCGENFYKGDIDALDTFTVAAVIISTFFTMGYAINVFIEIQQAFGSFGKLFKKFGDMPLTFDCPIFISSNMIIFAILLGMPDIFGKDYFNCVDHVLVEKIPEENMPCGISGYILFISLHACFWYTGLLSFSVFRYLRNPEAPLFKIHKKWYHLGLWIILVSLFVGSVFEEMYGNLPALGICGPSLSREGGTWVFVLGPLMLMAVSFLFFTGFSIYYAFKHVIYESDVGSSSKMKSDLLQLSIRLIIYQILVMSACIAFIVVTLTALEDYDETVENFGSYFFCLAFDSDPNSCKIGFTISNSVYYMQGVIALQLSSASFALSCSTRRIKSWKAHKVADFIGSKVKKIHSKTSNTGREGSRSTKSQKNNDKNGSTTSNNNNGEKGRKQRKLHKNSSINDFTRDKSEIASSADSTHIDPSDVPGTTEMQRVASSSGLNQLSIQQQNSLGAPTLSRGISGEEDFDNIQEIARPSGMVTSLSIPDDGRVSPRPTDKEMNFGQPKLNINVEMMDNQDNNNNNNYNNDNGDSNGVLTPVTPVTPLSKDSKEHSNNFSDVSDRE